MICPSCTAFLPGMSGHVCVRDLGSSLSVVSAAVLIGEVVRLSRNAWSEVLL